MTADVPTLLLMIIVTSLVTSGALLVLNGNQRNDGLQYWAGGLLLSALAHTLLLLYGRIPNLLTVVLGNVLLSSALASFWLAVRRFHETWHCIGPARWHCLPPSRYSCGCFNTSLPAVWSSVGSR